jgi:hypothetical protein
MKRDGQRNIQKAELRRRRAKWKEPPENTRQVKPFVRTLPASPNRYCWFCFESRRELIVAAITDVRFCRECATWLIVDVALQDTDQLIGPLLNACAAALPVVDGAYARPIAAQLRHAIEHAAEWLRFVPCDNPGWTEEDIIDEPRQPELPIPQVRGS